MEMSEAEEFFNSLTDEQTGFYFAHEHDVNLEDLLQDQLSIKQFTLYKEWKRSLCAGYSSAALLNVLAKLDDITEKLEVLTNRMDCIEKLQELQVEELQLLRANQTPGNIFNDSEESKDTSILVNTELHDSPPHVLESELQDKNWLQNFYKQFKDRNISQEKVEELGNLENVEKLLCIMKKQRENTEIQYRCCDMMRKLSKNSASRPHLISSGVLGYLRNLFVDNWFQRNHVEKTLIRILWVFINIGVDIADYKYLLKDTYFELFLLPFSVPDFSKVNIVAGELLFILLAIDDDSWNFRLSKENVNDAFNKNMDTWILGKFDPYQLDYTDGFLCMEVGTTAQRRYFVWMIANHLTTDPESIRKR